MEKLRRVLSGQDDEEQGLTAQVAAAAGPGGARARVPASRGTLGRSGFPWGPQKPPTPPRVGLLALGGPGALPGVLRCAGLCSGAGRRRRVAAASSCSRGKPASGLRVAGARGEKAAPQGCVPFGNGRPEGRGSRDRDLSGTERSLLAHGAPGRGFRAEQNSFASVP